MAKTYVTGTVAQDEVRDGPCHVESTGHGRECGPFQAGEGQDLFPAGISVGYLF